jgi:hypothetical protein
MPLPFSVSQPVLQDLLEWVAQPPLMVASNPLDPDSPKVLDPRDTRAIRFHLRRITPTTLPPTPVPELHYQGFLFFRPGKTNTPIFQQQPGLMGIGNFQLVEPNCQYTLGLKSDGTKLGLPRPDHHFVRVDLRFRPPKTFAGLSFRRTDGSVSRSVQMTHVDVFGNANMRLDGDRPDVGGRPEAWFLDGLSKSTLLSPI